MVRFPDFFALLSAFSKKYRLISKKALQKTSLSMQGFLAFLRRFELNVFNRGDNFNGNFGFNAGVNADGNFVGTQFFDGFL